jgi:hypothetical protein
MGQCCPNQYFFEVEDPPPDFDKIIEECQKKKEVKEPENPYAEPGTAIQIFPPIRRKDCLQLGEGI